MGADPVVTDFPKITFRQDAVGGAIADPEICPPEALQIRRQLVLLIHGFNNSESAAADDYQRFEDQMSALWAVPRGSAADDRIIEVYWPGDADWGFAKPLAYMRSVPRAAEVGNALANLLISTAAIWGPFEVDIVAHSLGCRVALELLLTVHNTPAPAVTISRIVFMAAAAATFTLDNDASARFRAAYESSLQEGSVSLYSGADDVLRFAFPPGQTLAGEGFFPTAVGHAAWPVHGQLERMKPQEMPGAGHGSYWGGDAPDCSKQTATIAHDYLQIPDAISREVPTRILAPRTPPTQLAIAPRAVPVRRPGRVC